MVSLQESPNFAFVKECLQKAPLCHAVRFLRVHRGLRFHVLEAQEKAALAKWHHVMHEEPE